MQDIIDNITTSTTNVTNNIIESSVSTDAGIFFVFYDGGTVLSTGVKGYLPIPFACTIDSAELVASPSGSIKIDIWKDITANFPPTDADTITGGGEPEIVAAQLDYDAVLSGWTTTIDKYDILGFNIDSCSTITKCTLTLFVTKTGL